MKRLHREEINKRLQTWNPFEDTNIASDPYRTLFVGRLNFQTTEKKLRKEFEEYGQIKSIRIVRDS
jgi:U1 small nuclear ribonucleoprotein